MKYIWMVKYQDRYEDGPSSFLAAFEDFTSADHFIKNHENGEELEAVPIGLYPDVPLKQIKVPWLYTFIFLTGERRDSPLGSIYEWGRKGEPIPPIGYVSEDRDGYGYSIISWGSVLGNVQHYHEALVRATLKKIEKIKVAA